MGAFDPAEAVEILDRLLNFFRDGERWTKGRLSDRRGNRCLLGALDFVSSHYSIKGDAAERYLADEVSVAPSGTGICGECARFRAGLRQALSGGRYRVSEAVLRRDALSDFNDGCKDFAELRAVIVEARATALGDASRGSAQPAGLDPEAGELVMA